MLLIFQIKHMVCDYPLQTSWMLKKFLPGWKWVLPLAAHSAVHSGMTFLILMTYGRWVDDALVYKLAPPLCFLDFTIHFIVDRIKASPSLLGRFKALSAKEYTYANDIQKRNNAFFWWSLGLDQMWHHLTHYAILYVLFSRQ